MMTSARRAYAGSLSMRARVASIPLALALLLSFSVPADAAKPPPCGEAQLGQYWIDPDSGIVFRCTWREGFGYGWRAQHPLPPAQEDAWTFGDSQMSVKGSSVLSDETFGHSSIVYSRAANFDDTPIDKPVGWLSARTILNYFNGSAWVTCRDSGWVWNTDIASSWSVGLQSASPWCGDAWYYADALGWVWNGSVWRGGGITTPTQFWSGGGGGAAAPIQAPPPAGAPRLTIPNPLPPAP
jgi:hypothetical protein